MAQQEVWTVDGYNLSQYAHDIQTFDGLDVTPDLKGEDVDIPQMNGVLPVVNYFQAAHKAVSMIVSVADPATGVIPNDIPSQRLNFNKNLDSLCKIMYRRKLLNVVRTLADGSQRTALCKVVAGIQPATLGLASAQIVFDLLIPGSFWRDTAATTQTLAIAATPTTLHFNSFDSATAPMSDLVYTIAGPITNPKITDLETGAWVQFTGAGLTAGQTLAFDAGAMTVTGGGGLATPALTTITHAGDPRWLTAVPSIDGINLQVDSAGAVAGGTQLTVSGKRAYLR